MGPYLIRGPHLPNFVPYLEYHASLAVPLETLTFMPNFYVKQVLFLEIRRTSSHLRSIHIIKSKTPIDSVFDCYPRIVSFELLPILLQC